MIRRVIHIRSIEDGDMAKAKGKQATTGGVSRTQQTAKGTASGIAQNGSGRVTLNVDVKATTRAGLNKLKLLLGLPNQGAVLDKLIREGLAAAKGR